MIGRTSRASRFILISFLMYLGLRGMEKVVSKRDDFVVDVPFYFEPVMRCEYSTSAPSDFLENIKGNI